jgi:23S rRNA (cytidine1920-2'-O)/16S rRNA (cytidine1409-2'-O)-methyltransferase
MTKERLDRLLVDRGLVESRNQAYAAIITGEVKVDGQIAAKPAQLIAESAKIEYSPKSQEYVSRGGLKLVKALDDFKVDVKGLTVFDAGASTGGFTDCLLRRGASKVIAVDVGYGQLAWKLRQDPRVEVHERVNLRFLTPEELSGLADLATLDLSFISLVLVMDAVVGCLKEHGAIIALVKPQFEVGKGNVGRGGIVKDSGLHISVLKDLSRTFIGTGLSVIGMTWSPIRGAKGNAEYWLHLSKNPSVGYPIQEIDDLAVRVVAGAHKEGSR